MAIDTDKLKDDASGILNLLGKVTPGGMAKSLAEKLQGNQAEVMKVIKRLLRLNPTTAGATQAVEFIVDRYKIPESVAARMVANELTDANISTDPSGSADEMFPSRPEFESSAEDTSVMPEKKTSFLDLSNPDIRRQIENLKSNPTPLPRPIRPENFDDMYYPEGPGAFPKKGPFRPGEGGDFKREPFIPGEGGDFQFLNQGGRVGFQTGGITEQRILPPEYIEALGKTYAADLTRQAGIPSITTAQAKQPGETDAQFAQRQSEAQQFGIRKAGMADLAPQVAAQDALQTAAYTQATDPTTGLGAYQPFLTKAGTAADAATGLTGPMTTAQTTAYMSPFQQQVIDASLADYDAQAAKSRLGLGSAAVLGGAFGSGRQGVAEAEFDALSNRGRSGLQANLLQQGFEQAQTARQQDVANQMGLANLQSGLGGQAQGFAQSQIAGLGTLGSAQQGQSQAVLDAQRQFAQMAVQEPINRLNLLGSGVTGLMGGTSGQGTTIGEAPGAPQSSPLATALGAGLTGADIYGRIFGRNK